MRTIINFERKNDRRRPQQTETLAARKFVTDRDEAILLLEDDEDLRGGLTFALSQEGYTVTSVGTVADAARAAGRRAFDLLILDVMLPDGSGLDFCVRLRSSGSRPLVAERHAEDTPELAESPRRTPPDVPVIFLTARDDEVDVVHGLEIGADDYVTKPFRLRELLSRVRVRLRRRPPRETTGSKKNGVLVDTRRATVTKDGEPVSLTASEYRLLLALFEHAGQVLSRNQLAARLLGTEDAAIDDNTIAVFIRRLREKIETDPSNPRIIRTVRGLGYRFEDPQ